MIVKVDHITTLDDEHIVTLMPLDAMVPEKGLCHGIDVYCNNESVKRFRVDRTYNVAIEEVPQ